MTVLRIVDWDKHFENNRSRELKSLDWVPVPNKMDGDGYTAMLEIRDNENPLVGAARYGAWCAMVLLASKSQVRGYLFRTVTIPQAGAVPFLAHDYLTMARISRLPASAFESCTERALEVGWVERIELSDQEVIEMSHNPAGGCGLAPKELNRIESIPPNPLKGDARRGEAARGKQKRMTREEAKAEREAAAFKLARERIIR